MEKIKVSIIIRAHNAEATVARAIQSALKQDFSQSDYEVIIIDDGSTDGTVSVVESYSSDARIRILTQENKGAIPAANTAFSLARGEYVTLLDSDDEFDPGLLKEVIPVLDADPTLAFAYVDYREEFEGMAGVVSVRDVFEMISGGTVFRREPFAKEGFFSNVCIFDEYELILRTWGRWRFVHIPKALYVYHRSRSSLTGNPQRVEESIATLVKLYPNRGEEIKRIRSYTLPA